MTAGTPLPVLLDCDTANEIDDQYAIAYALGSPSLDVRGVISVHDTYIHGPGSVERYQEEAERVVRLCGRRDVPCVRGATRPMESRDEVLRSDGLELLIETARAATQPLHILATGPLTDVAALLLAAPELAERVRVVWMGGFAHADVFRQFRFSDLNGRADIAAWRVVLERPVPLLHIPGWPGLIKLRVQYPEMIAALRALASPIAEYLAEITEGWQNRTAKSLTLDDGGKVLWDVANVAALTVPHAFTVESLPCATLDAAAAHDFDRPGRTVEVVTDLDRDAILADMRVAFGRLPALV